MGISQFVAQELEMIPINPIGKILILYWYQLWKHMMALWPGNASHYWPFVLGIHQSPVESPHKRPVIWNFNVFFAASLHKLLIKLLSCPLFKLPLWPSDIAGLNGSYIRLLLSPIQYDTVSSTITHKGDLFHEIFRTKINLLFQAEGEQDSPWYSTMMSHEC